MEVVVFDNLLLLVALYDGKFITKLLLFRFSREWLTWQDAVYTFEVTDRFFICHFFRTIILINTK